MKLTANVEDRTITGLVLPFNEVGRTNLGGVTASEDSAIEFDSDMTLNMEHDGTRPLGRIVGLPETSPEGVVATFKVANTTGGTDLLTEVAEGLRTGLSVELDKPVIRAGRLISGALTAVAAVTRPAFNSARVLTAADAGELPEGATEDVKALRKVLEIIAENTETPEADEAADSTEENEVTDSNLAATDTAAPVATVALTATTTTTPRTLTASDAFRAIAAGKTKGGDKGLEAALANVVHDDGDNDGDGLGEITAAPAWLGEVYSKAPYARKYIPLIGSGTLTSYRSTGFRFTTLPVVAPYAGNKAEVPTGGMTAVPVSYNAERWAHAADIDRRYIDFGDSEVLRAFVEAQVDSYKRVTDVATLVDIIGSGTALTPGTVPSGVNAAIAAIADGALALVAADFRPTFAIVGSDLYRDVLLTPKDKVTEFLSQAFGLEEGAVDGFKIVPSAHADALGQVIVGDGSTLRLKELGGGAPVRVEAEHLANGGRDVAVFGYTQFEKLVDGGVRVVDLTPAP